MIGFTEYVYELWPLCSFKCQNSEWKDDFVFRIAEIVINVCTDIQWNNDCIFYLIRKHSRIVDVYIPNERLQLILSPTA